MDVQSYIQRAYKKKKENQDFYDGLGKKTPRDLDEVVENCHNQVFEKINCLDCANCCKSISPIIEFEDIHRASKALNIEAGNFIEQYLYMDEDGDFVFQNTPCPMLGEDNKCIIYEARPKACQEYPHTNHKYFQKRLKLTIKNLEFCPATYEITELLKAHYS